MKTKEELSTLKTEVEALKKKLSELTEDELKQVTGGTKEEDEQILNLDQEERKSDGKNSRPG